MMLILSCHAGIRKFKRSNVTPGPCVSVRASEKHKDHDQVVVN